VDPAGTPHGHVPPQYPDAQTSTCGRRALQLYARRQAVQTSVESGTFRFDFQEETAHIRKVQPEAEPQSP
jgi:hypothetical protein